MTTHTEACGQLLGPLRTLLGFRQTALQRAYQSKELSTSGTGLLAELVHGGESRACDLAHNRVVDASVVSRQLGQLEQEGLVERRPDPADRRVSLLRATERGRQVLAEREAQKANWLSHALRDWDEADVVRLTELLRALSCDLLAASRETLSGPAETTEEGNR
ncbi:MarR family winged helix-turn-helix transcriptional regulator [Actinopolyspora mortivallis]|uniref:MarR family transcriptional regulator n=1 Tax=Actinopolyspora mortivallis TaxID=33906 RepID=A0A2T0GUI0_ACTMO|nr:MarR family transcriptional regulator [Actinopolyspora mortivallis]PRW62775.1 MarR family transcriptional regulator [Actinopolyspora mortivallis]